jgi:hypothetical protein
LLSGGLQATWNVTFTPDTTGPFEDSRRFYAMRDQLNPACFIDVVLRGQGALPELSITYGDPECGGTLRVPVTLRNESALRLDALDARATSGYALSPDPPGSFSAISFSLGPEGSVNPPAERQFILRYPLAAPNPASPSITVRQTTSVLKTEAIPAYGCIEIVEPSALTLDFGDVVVNTAAPGQSIRLANRGNAAASVTARLTTAGQGFGLGAQGAGSQTLNVPPISDTTTLPVSFLPPAPGPKQSAVSFTSAAPGSIPNVNLLGAGVDQPTVSLSFEAGGTRVSPGGTIRLPSTEVGQTSAAIPFVIRNDGGLAASNLGVTVSGSEFLISDSTPPQLLPGQSMDYALTFRPAQTGRRGGMLTVMGSNLANTIQFALEGDGVMGAITVNGIGLSANVVPAQTPLPTVGLELAGGAAQQTILGDLMLEFIPNLPQAPPAGFAEAYQAVRFMAGGGSGGRTIGFQFSQGQQRAVFSAEQQAGADAQAARFQTGTVAGTLRFQAINLRTSDGSSVNVADPIVGSVSVERLAPSIRSLNTPATGTGVNVVVESVSTTREITGVCLALNAAAGADLSFTRPDATFLNTNFSQWFSSNPSFAHGGAFSLTIPIDISNSSTFGSAQVWLRNSQGWSAPNSPCP